MSSQEPSIQYKERVMFPRLLAEASCVGFWKVMCEMLSNKCETKSLYTGSDSFPLHLRAVTVVLADLVYAK